MISAASVPNYEDLLIVLSKNGDMKCFLRCDGPVYTCSQVQCPDGRENAPPTQVTPVQPNNNCNQCNCSPCMPW